MANIFGMVTTRSSARYTLPALESFFRHTSLRSADRFLLIDNDNCWSEPLSGPLSRVEVVRNTAPKGFAANANQALEAARSSQADLYFLNNDLIFSQGWLEPLLVNEPAILSPLSPREVQYACSVVNTKTKVTAASTVLTNPFDLESYQRCPAAFDYIASAHRSQAQGYWSLFVVPFFAVKIPFGILATVGRFDEAYGAGGAEDYDYCLRAVLAGFEVRFALSSYLLHFAGKSSWAGPEDQTHRSTREQQFMRHFEAKWGEKLFRLFFNEDQRVISDIPALMALQQQGKLKAILEDLLEGRPIQITL